MEMMEVFDRLGGLWAVKPGILKDIYLLMRHDVRFMSMRNGGGIKYRKMEHHIKLQYRVFTITERRLRYLVRHVESVSSKNM